MRQNNRALAGVLTAALALSVAVGVNAAADTDSRTSAQAPVLSKAEKKAVKKIAIQVARKQARKQANKAITKRAPGLTVGKALNADFATKATLADVATNATNAQNAANAAKVGGLDVKKVNATIPSGGPAVVLVTQAGFTVTATCAAGVPELTAAATPTGGRIRSARIDNLEAVSTNGSSNLTSLPLIGGGDGLGSVTAEYVSPGGQVLNLWVGYRDDAPGCAFFGNYLLG